MNKLIKSYKGSGNQSVLINSGVHGNELTSLFLAADLNRFVQGFLNLVSKITIVIGYSEKAIELGIRQINDFDVNRSIDISPRLDDLRKLILEHDVVIDLHSSFECWPFVLIDNNEYANRILNWCIESKVPYLIRDFVDNGTTIKNYALENGKLGITFEMQGVDKIDNLQVDIVFNHIYNLLMNMNSTNKKEYKIKNSYPVISTESGFLKRIVDLGDFLEIGDPIGYILNYELKKVAIFKATEPGFLLVGPGKDFINKGEEVFNVQPTLSN